MHPQSELAPIPRIGYGTWNRSSEEAYQGSLWALEAGYRHIDTAQGYENEQDVGRAIRDSGLDPREVFLTTKVKPGNFAPGRIMPSVRESLDKLGMDKVDLLLLHWPAIKNQFALEDYISQFAEVYDAGLADRIGVSNFTIPLLTRTIELLGDRPLATNQVECHVYMQNRPIVDHCRSIGLSITAYSPLARGRVADDALLRDIGKAHDAGPDQVALAFLLHEGHIVIPSSARKERIVTNLKAGEIRLSDDEIARIRTLEKGMRLVNGDWCPVWDT
ncbi:aldo/keto reductase [Rhizobium sp. RU36D]|uniref:aldo/keto reductase n=1 Tax=Rhizobium sp. RU36D TaxID=1907415 RepID=UPI0009D79EEA|nr:aldo/keto reductase [Rhizobium sp. RU36D]SMC42799.1 2,5-diketo-D-gluconate reductase B [Rhizobium sp. RU36D]